MRLFFTFSALSCLAVGAFAQSRSSFLDVSSFTGISVSLVSGNTYQLTVGPAPTFTYNSVSYAVKDVFGIWALNNSNTGLGASGTSQNGWSYQESNNPDDIAGWKTNPNTGITNPGGSLSFTYTSLNATKIDQWGFHVRLASGTFPNTTGNTGYVTASSVPEPASMAVLGIGVAALIKKRRKK